jgi:hypothetical protein
VKVEERFMPARAANADRARIVRSVLSLAVVGTLLAATLVPLPEFRSRQDIASSPSVVLRDWERRNWARDEWERLISEILALQTSGIRSKAAQQLPAIEGQEVYYGFRPFPTESTTNDDSALLPPDANLGTDQQPDDASRP